jgi:hypothetical protein
MPADQDLIDAVTHSCNSSTCSTAPYTVHLNDIASFDLPGFTPAAYEQQVIDEFDRLYAEGSSRLRLMIIGLRERLSGQPVRVRALDRVFCPAPRADDAWWAPKTRSPGGPGGTPTPPPGSTVTRPRQLAARPPRGCALPRQRAGPSVGLRPKAGDCPPRPPKGPPAQGIGRTGVVLCGRLARCQH